MKFHEVLALKQARGLISNKMMPGPSADKTVAPAVSGRASRIRADVLALASELEVDASALRGTGANGAVTMADVRMAASMRAES